LARDPIEWLKSSALSHGIAMINASSAMRFGILIVTVAEKL